MRGEQSVVILLFLPKSHVTLYREFTRTCTKSRTALFVCPYLTHIDYVVYIWDRKEEDIRKNVEVRIIEKFYREILFDEKFTV